MLACALLLGACRNDETPVLAASGLRVLAPLPGRSEAVAYVTLSNHGARPVIINEVTSPAFARVEMHETRIVDDVAQMRPLENVTIDAGASVEFAPGGMHLMLIGPLRELAPGEGVRLELHHDDGGLLMLDAPLSARETS